MALYILISVLLGVKSKACVDTSYLNGMGKNVEVVSPSKTYPTYMDSQIL
jgi:hypothetical protein